PGAGMMMAQATAVAIGDCVGLLLGMGYLWRTFDAYPPPLSVLRIAGATAIALVSARGFPSGGKVMGLMTLAAVGLVYRAALIILRELGPSDAAKLQKILRRKAPTSRPSA